MLRSQFARVSFQCARSKYAPRLFRPFSTSFPVWESQESFLKSKSTSIHENITGEKWFPSLDSPRPTRFLPKEEAEELVKGLQNEEDGTTWREVRTRAPPKNEGIKDASGLFREDGSVTVDPVYLRDSCQCRLCVDGSTLQRHFVTAHIPQDIQPVFKGRSSHGRVKVGWKNDIPGYPAEHQSVYSQSYLRALTGPHPPSPVARKRLYWDRESFEKRANWTSYADFMKDTEAFKTAVSALHRDGLIFIRDVEESEQTVVKMGERLGPLRNTFYGSTWNVRSLPNAKNVAYTNQYLGFHMDLLYLTTPPAYQLLHVLKNSCSGGESRFADSFFAATRLRQENEKAYRLLCRYPVEWMYDNDGQFYLQRRPTFHEIHHFIGNEEGAAHRLERQANGDKDADLAYVNWSPPFQGRLYHDIEHPERTRDFLEALRAFDRILNSDDMVFELKMDEGTCMIFENRRIVHGRNAFEVGQGERWLRGTYVDEDAFWSRCQALGADRYDTSNIQRPAEPRIRKYELPTDSSV
jgi:alpha-ketoglutarate-dependent taurine dioxygenase